MKKNCILMLAALAILMPAVVSAVELKVFAEENPPFNTVKNGEAQGAATELFLAVTKKAGMTVNRADVKTVPWARGYDSVQKDPDTVLFPMARTEAREALFKWVGPVYKVRIGLIAKKGRKLQIPDAATASKYKIGTVREGAPEQAIIAAGVSVDLLDRGNDLVSNLKKLQADRIDLLAFNAVAASFNMAPLGMDPADYEVVFVLSEPKLFFALSKNTGDETVKSLQTALDALKADGSYDAIIKKFIP